MLLSRLGFCRGLPWSRPLKNVLDSWAYLILGLAWSKLRASVAILRLKLRIAPGSLGGRIVLSWSSVSVRNALLVRRKSRHIGLCSFFATTPVVLEMSLHVCSIAASWAPCFFTDWVPRNASRKLARSSYWGEKNKYVTVLVSLCFGRIPPRTFADQVNRGPMGGECRDGR